MHIRSILHLISYTLGLIGIAQAFCILVAFLSHDPGSTLVNLSISSLTTLVAAFILWKKTKGEIVLSRRDGFGIVTFGWLLAALFGALPYLLSHVIDNPISAFFESMSGFTTTGASVMSGLDAMPRGLLFWRCMSQWIGGMGVLVLVVAILPFIGVGGMQLYRAEMPGPSKDRLAPRIATTAKYLWMIYVGFSLAEAVLLKLAGMSWFDSFCHTFTTMSTGGFSTHDASVAHFDSLAIEIIIILFMFLAGVNFSLHFRACTGDIKTYFRDVEFRYYLGLWAIAILSITIDTWLTFYDNVGESLRAAAFQVTTIVSTTGFATADYDAWSTRSRFIILLLMFTGGCAGSTSGGMKIIRYIITSKKAIREMQLFMMPNAIVNIRFGKAVVPQSIVAQITAFMFIFLFVGGVSSFLMTFFTPDLETAFSSVIACLGNIGPGFGLVGPTHNFGSISLGGQFVLTILMLLGRLELYTVLVICLPRFWRQ